LLASKNKTNAGALKTREKMEKYNVCDRKNKNKNNVGGRKMKGSNARSSLDSSGGLSTLPGMDPTRAHF
jgi:hypothetical protein